jgi:dTDP-4-amino-4,6-dideoxygalactose transaminase
MSDFLPVARPLMPTSEALLPYLTRIDQSRFYSNFGPLVVELQQRLAARFHVGPGELITVANATTGITIALQALTSAPGGICYLPAWTFVATAHAVAAAGLQPVLLDIDYNTWSITPAIVRKALQVEQRRPSAVVPVAPFGAPLAVEDWDAFTQETGVPVIMDAAAGFDTVRAARNPSIVSLHATKILGAGEGGFALAENSLLVKEIHRRTNFGFYGSRDAQVPAHNAKMSEYHAAVALASLDQYCETRAGFMRVASAYRNALSNQSAIVLQPGFGVNWISSTCMARVTRGDSVSLAKTLRDADVGSLNWWGAGVHTHGAFADLNRVPYPATAKLAKSTLGIPFFSDMTDLQVQRVCRALLSFATSHT